MPKYNIWEIRTKPPIHISIEHIHPITIDILSRRGFLSKSQIIKFLDSNHSIVNPPSLLPDIEKGAKRLHKAIKNNENILIYGDYDADGITALSITTKFLLKLGIRPFYYINDRITEGYGISTKGIEYAKNNNIDLIITVDNGISAFDEINLANSYNIDIIVTDHHETKDILPNAIAIINPMRKDSVYPFKEISGCLVAFKFCEYINEKYSYNIDMTPLIQLVAIGSIADVMPVLNENRYFIKKGIELIKESPLPGIEAIIESSKINKNKLNTYAIGFIIGPRLNAMGRLSKADEAYKLLTIEDLDKIEILAEKLENTNRKRQKIDRIILKEADLMAQEKIKEGYNVIVLYGKDWHEGVLGIVSSRICEKYNKPTILLSMNNKLAKGSGRSVDNFNLLNALKKCEVYLKSYGGHAMAAGLLIENDKLGDFENCLNKLASDLEISDIKSKIMIDCEIPFSVIDNVFYNDIQKLHPFGAGNPPPVFISYNVSIVGKPRIVGNEHLKIVLRKNGKDINAIAFGGKHLLDSIINDEIDICYTVYKNSYMGNESIELKIFDIRNADNQNK
jgi:single-stranded-DNA-specific exonuclease